MIVSDEHKFLFLSIPKTGSGVCQDHLRLYGHCSRREAQYNHLTADQMIKKVGIEKWNSYRKVVFARNPWDRYVSLFLWIRRYNTGREKEPQFVTFSDYVSSGGEHGQHQRDFIFNKDGKIIVDFVGQFESLFDDLCEMSKFLGVAPPKEIGHTNHNANRGRLHYTKYYTEPWLIEVVGEREKYVIDRYGYKFGEDGSRWL